MGSSGLLLDNLSGRPLAFLGYELGYGRGIGHIPLQLRLPKVTELQHYSHILLIVLFPMVAGVYLYTSIKFGISAIGLNAEAMMSYSYPMKAIFFLWYNLFGLCIGCIVLTYYKGDYRYKIIAIVAASIAVMILFLINSRIFGVDMGIIAILTYQLINKRNLMDLFKWSIIILSGLFLIITGVRTAYQSNKDLQGTGISINERMELTANILKDRATLTKTSDRIENDFGYRFNAIEVPAAIFALHEQKGIPYMWGEEFFWGAYTAIPEPILPFPKEHPGLVTIRHFHMENFNQNTTMIGSALADAGIWGIFLAFWMIGFSHGLLWRYMATGTSLAFKFSFFSILDGLICFNGFMGMYFALNLRQGLIVFFIVWVIVKISNIVSPHYS